MKLIATKRLKYDTRRMQAGDEFDATDMHARVLVGARKARYAPAQIVEPPPSMVEPEAVAVMPTEIVEATDEPSIDKLRAQAERLGIAVDGRWGIYRLQQEIAQAKR
jgi:hypothetical protein